MATPHMQLDFPVPKGPLGPSNSTICPRTAPKTPRFCAHWPPTAPNQKQTISCLGYVVQNTILIAPNPPTTTHFWWIPALKIALTDAWTPVPRPSGLAVYTGEAGFSFPGGGGGIEPSGRTPPSPKKGYIDRTPKILPSLTHRPWR